MTDADIGQIKTTTSLEEVVKCASQRTRPTQPTWLGLPISRRRVLRPFMSNLIGFGQMLEPGDAVRIQFERRRAAEEYNDLQGVVATTEEDGWHNVRLTMTDGSTSLRRMKTRNLVKVYSCDHCGAQDVQLRCSRCRVTGE